MGWEKTAGDIHWDYYTLLEDDLADIFSYIEPVHDNRYAYGPKLVKLLLAVGSEVDVMFKDVSSAACYAGEMRNIGHFKSFASQHLDETFFSTRVTFDHTNLVMTPWKAMEDGRTSPDWWNAYNDVKHNRLAMYQRANLWNVIDAMAGLFVMNEKLISLEMEHGVNESWHQSKITNLYDERYEHIPIHAYVPKG